MCGLAGLILGRDKRSQRDLDWITDAFTRLVLFSEYRGPHATGVACVRENGSIAVEKKPIPARVFVNSSAYLSWLSNVNQDTTYLMGHTRWPTKGSIHNPDNNHPILAEIDGGHCVALTHNGSIREPDKQFKRLGLPRTAQVDSELLVRLAQRHAGVQGLDVGGFIAHLPALHGRMSTALMATTKPNEVILLKGNMPLEVRLHRKRKVVAYASEPSILNYALKGNGWDVIPVSAGEGLVVDSHDISAIRRFRFEFGGVEDEVECSLSAPSG